MTREEALTYLKRRLDLANKDKYNYFDDHDLIFIRNYIHLIHNKMVAIESIAASFQKYPWNYVATRIDNFINHIILHFKIEVISEKLPLDIFGKEQFKVTDYR